MTKPLDSTAVQLQAVQTDQTDKPKRKIKPSSHRDPETGLTGKQKAFAHEYIQHANATEAVLAVYDTEKVEVARKIGYENLHNKALVSYIRSIGSSRNVTPDRLIAKLDEALQARKTVVTPSGETVEAGQDWTTQLRAVEQATKLLGLTGQGSGEAVPSQHVHLHGKSLDDLVGRQDRPTKAAKQRGKSGGNREADSDTNA